MIYDTLQGCIALRNILVQLAQGSKVVIIPESERHKQVEQACLLLEKNLLRLRSMSKPRKGGTKRQATKDITPNSLEVRKKRDKQTKAINALIDKYFQVHGRPKAVKQYSLHKKPNYVSEVSQ